MRTPPSLALSLAEVVTVGFPFCAFKVLTGVILLSTPAGALGYALIALGAIDFAFNAANFGSILLFRRRTPSVCLTDFVVLRVRGEAQRDLGLAVDVFLSFGLVAVVVGAGWIPRLPSWALGTWNAAVVLNVLGAGVGRLLSAIHRRERT